MVVGLTLTFYPVVKAFTLGQIQVWINALFALGLLAWAAGWKVSSGVLIGAISLIKPHYGLFLVWAALRREMRFAAACAATIGIGLAASVAVYGLANHIDYVRVLSFLSQHGEAYYPNQSVNGVLNRLMSIFDPQAYVSLDLPAGQFPPFTLWVWAATLASSLALLLFALLRPFRRDDRESRDRSFADGRQLHHGVAHRLGASLRSDVADLCRDAGDLYRRPHPADVARHLLRAREHVVPVTNLLAASPLNLLQSTLFAGAIILLVLLGTDKRRRLRPAPPPAPCAAMRCAQPRRCGLPEYCA